MHIALIHYRLLRNGGLETRLFNYLHAFREMGHSLTLVVSKIDPSIELPSDVNIEQVNLKRVPKPLRMYYFDKALGRIIPEGDFDLSLSLGRTSFQDLVLCPGNHVGYLRAMGKRFRSPIDRLNILLDEKAYAGSRLILAASEMMREELLEYYCVPPSKIEVLPPPIDTERFNAGGKKNKAALREKYGFSKDKSSLLFLTTGNRRKGYPFLLKLMEKLKDRPIELIVAGVKPIHSSLPNVKYIGYADKPEELLWAADGLIHPALYEPFGQVVTESIQCGTPVLISDRVGARQVVNDQVGQVVSGFSEPQWLQAIEGFVNTEFQIPEDFALTHKLTVEQHCRQILNYGEMFNQTR